MKKIITLLLAAFTVLSAVADSRLLANDAARQALYGALDNAESSLRKAPFNKAPVAILPLKAGYSLLAGRLKNMLVKNGFVCVEGKEDPMWDEILKEVEWDERKSDILDSRTIVKFGKLKAAKILLQCEIRILDKNADRVYAEIDLRATEIATKQIIWGGTFAYRHYTGKDVTGIISLDSGLRMLLKKNFEKAGVSLKSPEFASKIADIKTVMIVPLAGDIDRYMTGLTIEMVAHTRLYPRNPRVASVSKIRADAREKNLGCDAVMYGAVRDLQRTKGIVRIGKGKIFASYKVSAEIQLVLENASNGNILWSKTVTLSEDVVKERIMDQKELLAWEKSVQRKKDLLKKAEKEKRLEEEKLEQERKKQLRKEEDEKRRRENQLRDEKVKNFSSVIMEHFVDYWTIYLAVFAGIIVLCGLIIAGIVILKAVFSYNNVR